MMRIVERTVLVLLMYASVLSFYGVIVLTARGVGNAPHWIGPAIGAMLATAVFVAVWRFGPAVCNTVRSAADWIADRIGLNPLSLLGIGVLIRLAWTIAVPVQPVSDGVVYLGLARQLLAEQPYQIAGTLAYWPPGYPFFLTPWLTLVESNAAAVIASNLFLFVVGGWGLWKLAQSMLPPKYACLCLAIYTFWPNLIFQTGLPEKELVLVALLPWVLFFWLTAITNQAFSIRVIAAGILFGFCVLVQPAVQLLPLFLFGVALVTQFPMRTLLKAAAFWGVGTALVVLPWTARNYAVLDAIVLVSTNGGGGLYRANNPLATGGYTDRAEHDLSHLGEVEADKEGKRLAIKWIAEHPIDATRLAFEKNVRFMGDDAAGAYHALRRGPNERSASLYFACKALANGFWLALWTVILAATLLAWRKRIDYPTALIYLQAAFLYSFLLHSIAESAGKYHVLWSAVLGVMTVASCVLPKQTNAESPIIKKF